MRVMIGELESKDINHVNRAFREWLHANKKIPTPSDIILLINGYEQHEREMQEGYVPPTGRTNQDWQYMTNEQKDSFNHYLENIKANLKPEVDQEADKQATWKQNYSHFESLPEEVRRQKTLSLKNMITHGDPTEN